MSSYNDFLMNYPKEIREALRQISKMREMIKIVDAATETADDFYDMWEEKDPLQNYDKYIKETVEGWVFSHSRIEEDDLARVAVENMNRNGTEKQMILYAIDDLCNFLKDHTDFEEELEESTKPRSHGRKFKEGDEKEIGTPAADLEVLVNTRKRDNIKTEVYKLFHVLFRNESAKLTSDLSKAIEEDVKKRIRFVARANNIKVTDEDIEDSDVYFDLLEDLGADLTRSIKEGLNSNWFTEAF